MEEVESLSNVGLVAIALKSGLGVYDKQEAELPRIMNADLGACEEEVDRLDAQMPREIE